VPHISSRARAAESREGPVVDSSRLLKFERRRRETTTRGGPTEIDAQEDPTQWISESVGTYG